MKRALVMSGGGGKGAYQFGVWKALRKLNIKFDIVTGTSIGALNGALIVQNDYLSLWYLWNRVGFDTLFGYKMKNDIDSYYGKKETLKMYAEGILKEKGMNVARLERLAKRFIKEDEIRNSYLDYGIVTFNLSDFKPQILTKEKIPKGKLIDFIIASATCFPAFQMKEIDGKKYVDGGYYDNMPINLAIEMGADEIIAVDLRALGFMQKIKNKNVKITTIAPHNDLGSFLVFDKKISYRNVKYGYNDTMKKFNYLDGNKFTFKKGDLEKNYNHYIKTIKGNIFGNLVGDGKICKLISSSNIYDVLNGTQNDFNELIEFLGEIYELDDSKIYKTVDYNKLLKKTFSKEMSKSISDGNELLDIKDGINDDINRKIISYFYNNNDLKNIITRRLAMIFSKQFVAALYLRVI